MIIAVSSDDQAARTLVASEAARLVDPADEETIRRAIRDLVAAPEQRRLMAAGARRLVDGRDAERVAEAMLGLSGVAA